MDCFRCDQPAVQECARCGALYCDEHGDALCERCMDPALALPSYQIYRGSLLALLVGTIFAVWLLVRPGTSDADSPPASLANAIPPASTQAAGASGARGTATAPAATPTPTPTAAATPAPTATPAQRTHTVRAGDTLYGIADQYRGSAGLQEFLERILALNGLRESSIISAGDTLRIPPP